MSKFLTVNFNCSTNCKTCVTDKTKCTSCYGLSTMKYLVNNECKASCASNEYVSSSLNTCSACSSPCKTCFGTAQNCTSCDTDYKLLGNSCKSTSLFKGPYYFYCSGLAAVLSIFTLLIKICVYKTNWAQSSVAWIAIPEIVAWGFLFYLYFTQTTIFHIILLGAALGIHIILNIIYGMTHQRLILE